jgi:hypothetical protein
MASRRFRRGEFQQKGPNSKATTPSLMGHNHFPPSFKTIFTTPFSLSNPKIYLSSQNSSQILHPSQIQVKIHSPNINSAFVLYLHHQVCFISSLFFLMEQTLR